MYQKLSDKIESLENELIQFKEKVEKGKVKKWFKNPSIIISTIALTASIFFSINSLRTQHEDKKRESFNTKINFIEENIEKLLEEEKYFQTYLSNENLNYDIKNNFDILWNAKSNLILDKISKEYNKDTSIIIDPNLLLQFGRNLQLTGRIELARDVFQKALNLSKDYTTKLIANRFLANIYAIPSNFQDSIKSRDYRIHDIQTSKSNLHGEYAWESISRSFELWANDEFYLLKNFKNGNRLIDSALYYSSLLSELNFKKQQNQDRLSSTKLFYNNGINKYFIKEYWKVKLLNGNIMGEARINKNTNGIFIDIKIFENNILTIRYSGSGYFTTNNELSFDVSKTYFNKSFGNNNFINGYGLLKVKFNNGSLGSGMYFQFGEKSEKIIFY